MITASLLEKKAGSGTFQKGQEYFAKGLVKRLRASNNHIRATVEGTESYQVNLHNDKNNFRCDCTCPHAGEGNFCKHLVAVGLTWLETPQQLTTDATEPSTDPWQNIQAYLQTQSMDALVELLLKQAERDDDFYQSLLLKAESGHGHKRFAQLLREVIEEVTTVDGFIGYREVGPFAARIDKVTESLAEQLRAETATDFIELIEYAIERSEKAMGEVDDSSGDVGASINYLAELHQQACELGKPDPIALAERLFFIESHKNFDVFTIELHNYQSALGKKGLAHFRQLAEDKWQKTKSPQVGEYRELGYWRISRLMTQLAELSGDIEELIRVKSNNLSSRMHYLDIATTLLQAKQNDRALEWAERGANTLPDKTGDRLSEFLITQYIERQNYQAAIDMVWLHFKTLPRLEKFQQLHQIALLANIWPECREHALLRVDEYILEIANTTNQWKPKSSTPDYSLRISIALWEKNLDAAWLASQQGDCDRHLLISLADQLASKRSSEALSLYHQLIPKTIDQANNHSYAQAIELINKVDKLMREQKQIPQFVNYLNQLRLQFKSKRNFIKLLDELGNQVSA